MNEISSLFSEQALQLLKRHNQLRPLLQQLVTAEAVQHVSLSDEERDQAWDQFLGGRDRDEVVESVFSQHGASEEDLEWQLLLPIRVKRVAQQEFGPKAEARFLERKDQLDLVTYSLLRVKDLHLARELFLRIEGGEASFADLAANYSEGPERNSQGVVGPVPLTKAHPVLAERLRTSRDQELLPPFPLVDWWLVARREALQPAVFDAAMAERMALELFEEWIQEETQRKVTAMSGSALHPAA